MDNRNIKRLTDKGLEIFNKVKIELMKQYAMNNDTDLPNDGKIIENALSCFEEKLKENNKNCK